MLNIEKQYTESSLISHAIKLATKTGDKNKRIKFNWKKSAIQKFYNLKYHCNQEVTRPQNQ